MDKPKIFITVEGGCIVDVISNADIEYLIKDWDNIECGDRFDPDDWQCATKISPKELKEAIQEGL